MKVTGSILGVLFMAALCMVGIKAEGVRGAVSGDEEQRARDLASTTTPTTTAPGVKLQNIAKLAGSTSSLSTLYSLVVAAELGETLSKGGPFTVFAPVNGAFPRGTALADLKTNPALPSILTYHVVPGKLLAAKLKNGQTLTTVNGAPLKVVVNDRGVFVGGAKVRTPDVMATNGVVHLIQKVLTPPAATTAPAATTSRGADDLP